MHSNGLKILAIDDNRDNLTTLRAVAMDALPGASVLTALDGRKGIDLARSEDPDVILLDVVMPGMDGFEVCRILKNDELLRHIPVIFLTALKTSREYRIKALEAGAEAFLSKPVEIAELTAQVRAMSKIKAATVSQRREKERLAALVAERTRELELELSARKEAEKALKESEEKYRLLAEHATDVIWVLDMDEGRFQYISPSVERLRGYTVEEVMAQDIAAALTPDSLNHLQTVLPERVDRFNRGHVEFHTDEIEQPRKDGTSVWTEATTRYLRNPVTGHLEVIGVTRDITDRKLAAREHEKLEEQFRQAQKLEAVGRLAGGVAHDFNNMLQVIQGYTEMALSDLDAQNPLHPCIMEILKASNRAADLTHQLLAFARKQTVSPKVLDLNDVLSGMLKMLRRLIGENIELVWKPGHDLWPLKIDPSQVDQIVANLGVNSRDAIDGVGMITIETENICVDETYRSQAPDFEPGEYVLLAVSDTGCGMNQTTISQIFDPFFTTKPVGKGTGLGLATVYGIVKQNNGFIHVYSEPGQGTTFRLYLPRFQAELAGPAASPASEAARGGSETVLLVEDEAEILNIGRAILERLGYNVITADRPTRAVDLAREYPEKIHLLITDVVMPEMNGRELASELMAIKPDLKCLFMSGYTADIIAHRGVLDEGVHFLPKPFTLDSLARKIREILEQPSPDSRQAG